MFISCFPKALDAGLCSCWGPDCQQAKLFPLPYKQLDGQHCVCPSHTISNADATAREL